MDIQSIIAAKRDGLEHTQGELEWLAKFAAKGEIPDYQLSAWLMAAYLHPLSAQETAWLTLAMADSGQRMNLDGLPKPWVDKHSTGGVGDKTTLVLLPLLAACGLTVIKMSGRGLGITGGTIDKLESIPGFRTNLTPQELKDQARRIGLAITGQSPNLAPADKVFYSLRDATATVSSIPLIVSSILSKKIAGGADTIVLDVKAGSGAFMKSQQEADRLADALLSAGRIAGLDLHVAISDMDQPLGSSVGNAMEVAEAAAVLTQTEVGRFTDLCLDLAGLTLVAAEMTTSLEAGKEAARLRLMDGSALEKAQRWVEAQGGDPAIWTRPDLLPQAPQRRIIRASKAGVVHRIDAELIGRFVVDLGGGRHKKDDLIDPSVGVELHVEVGSKVQAEDPLCTVHYARQPERDLAAAFFIEDGEVAQQNPLFRVKAN